MRRLLALASMFVVAFCFSTNEVAAQTTVHYVKPGETLWTIAKNYNVSLLELQRINHKQTDVLFVGETLRIPQPISQADKDLLARLVHAEAKGEPKSSGGNCRFEPCRSSKFPKYDSSSHL